MTDQQTKNDAITWATRRTLRLFDGRQGHGGGSCTYRQLRPWQIRALLAEAWLAGRESRKAKR